MANKWLLVWSGLDPRVLVKKTAVHRKMRDYLVICCVVFCIGSGGCYPHLMMTSSIGNNIFRVTGHLCGEFIGPGEFPAQRPVTRSFDVFFDLRLNKWLSKQSWGWWFEMLPCPLWCHCNVSGSLQWYWDSHHHVSEHPLGNNDFGVIKSI